MGTLDKQMIECVDFWGNVTARVELTKGVKFAHCVTGVPIVVEELLETSCICRLKSGNLQEISHSQLEKWKHIEESVTLKPLSGQSVTLKNSTDESVTFQRLILSPVKVCAACGKQCSPRAKTCSPACRKRLSRMGAG